MNELFEKYPDEEFYGLLADDLIPHTSEWDQRLIEAAGRNKISQANDLTKNPKHCMHPCVGGDLVRAAGFFASPTCIHYGSELVWKELAKSFSRKEDYYALVQIVQDKNNPEMEGKVMIFKFGKKLNDMLEAQLKPEYGSPCNPFDLFEGKLFSIHSRKVGEWNNYDLCSFVGEKGSIEIEGRRMEKNQADMGTIMEYLKTGPKNLGSFEYKDWDDALTEKVMGVIRNTVPDGRLVNEIMAGVNTSSSSPAQSYSAPVSAPQSSSNSLYEEASSTKVGSDPAPAANTGINRPAAPTTASTLDDLYADL
jgi:hypothetical protein